MIHFQARQAVSKQSEAAPATRATAATGAQGVAGACRGMFPETLASITSDPNSSFVTSSRAPSQSSASGQNSAVKTGWNALIPPTPTPSAIASTTSETKIPTTPYASNAVDDAYWAKQPAAIQQLRGMQSPQREQLAEKLAAQGYSIDVPIMAWGWDAGITTQLRESAGYTWVPSGLQTQVREAPGIYSPGFTAYDPSKPPAGSILVG